MFDTLIADINGYIHANANNAITGSGLNGVLNAMVNALGSGMRFYGLATPGISPVVNQYPKFYLAFLPGTYSNFNVSNPPSFTSGFAVLYDSQGNNTWRMAVKSFDNSNDIFVINAAVRNNTFGTNTVFYVKSAEKTNQQSSFSIYALNKDLNTEQLVATYTYNQGALSGYKTHKIASNNITYTVSVNWDLLATGEQLDFTYEESKFPITAYAESSTDEDVAALKERLELVEYLGGGYSIDANGNFTRELILGATKYIGEKPDFTRPTTQADAESILWSGSNKIVLIPGYNDQATRRSLDLLWNLFPADNIYYIYLLNTRQLDYTITVNTIDADDTTIISSQDYTLSKRTIMEVQVIRQSDFRGQLKYKVNEFIS